jgi:hypothetical protein
MFETAITVLNIATVITAGLAILVLMLAAKMGMASRLSDDDATARMGLYLLYISFCCGLISILTIYISVAAERGY